MHLYNLFDYKIKFLFVKQLIFWLILKMTIIIVW